MTLFALSGLFIAVTALTLILILVIYGRKRLHLIWAFFNLSVFTWGIGTFVAGNATTPQLALFGWQLSLMGGVFIAPSFYHTVCTFCGIERRKLIIFGYSIGIITEILFIFKKVILLDNWTFLFNSIYYFKGTIFYFVIMLCWGGIVALSYLELFRFQKINKGRQYMQALYLGYSALFGFIGGASAHLPSVGLNIYPYGNFGVAIYAIIGTYAILRLHLLDIKVAFTRAGIFLCVYAFILGFPFYFGYKTNLWIWSTVFMAILATVGPLIYNFLTRKAENVILAEQKRYQAFLLKASDGMVHEPDMDKLLNLTVYLIKRAVRTDYAAAYLNDAGENKYVLKALRGSGRQVVPPEFSYDHPFIKYLETREEPFIYEEMPDNIRDSLGNDVKFGLVVPSIIKGSYLGFLIMGQKKNRTLFTEDDIKTFKILSNNASMAVVNCLQTDRIKKDQEILLNSEKLALIGGMAAGTAHQFNNRLNAFVLAANSIQMLIEDFLAETGEGLIGKEFMHKLHKLFDDINEFLEKIIWNVRRTEEIIRGVMNVSLFRAEGITMSEFKIAELIDQAARMLREKHKIKDEDELPITIVSGKDEIIYGDRLLIFESIYNTIDNSYEAIEEKILYKLEGDERKNFKPEIKIRVIQDDTETKIEVADNGVGIKDENRKRVFAPFYTTKPSSKASGSGIGTYFVKRNIEEFHKGKVWFESEDMKGTTFYFVLPRKAKA